MTDSTPSPKTDVSILTNFFASPTNNNLAHLRRILSTQSGIDSTLLLTNYTLVLVNSQLKRLLTTDVQALTQRLLASTSKSLSTLDSGEKLITAIPVPSKTSRLAEWQAGTEAGARLISEVRAFMRLWGLIGIVGWAERTHKAGPKDTLLRAIAWGQVAANATYLVLEHGAYLASKGVLRGWAPERMKRTMVWAARAFAVHVALDFLRLMRTWSVETASTSNEKEGKIAKEEAAWMWWRSFYIDTAYAPLAVHWSLEQGAVGETWVGLLGSVAGVLGFREAWRQTAA
ncbi:MAG: hypothetical protein M1828_002687 [Chrysothrix sp. TS-e1954]|nr:MAG: hypothetical protein M1828_002687 [Chrysothrix sp. TS-e1954]